MKLWIDDVRPAPEGYVWCKSVNETKEMLIEREELIKDLEQKSARLNINGYHTSANNLCKGIAYNTIELIDMDHDAGDYVSDGGDYIKLLDWLEETGRNYPIHIHSQNPVGIENMRRIIKRNGWREV